MHWSDHNAPSNCLFFRSQSKKEVIEDLKSGKLNYTAIVVQESSVSLFNNQSAVVTGKGTFKGVCGNCKKVCGYKCATCPHKAASGKGDAKGTGDGKCDHCGGKGHLSPSCWKKHPEKAPQWYKDKAGKESKETSNTSVEIMLAAVDEEDFSWARM